MLSVKILDYGFNFISLDMLISKIQNIFFLNLRLIEQVIDPYKSIVLYIFVLYYLTLEYILIAKFLILYSKEQKKTKDFEIKKKQKLTSLARRGSLNRCSSYLFLIGKVAFQYDSIN